MVFQDIRKMAVAAIIETFGCRLINGSQGSRTRIVDKDLTKSSMNFLSWIFRD
jgi:hypothetical protein